MKIFKRETLVGDRTDDRKRQEEKLDKVMLWMGEFEFTSLSILNRMLGLKKHSGDKFFERLIKSNYLVRFQSRHLHRIDLVRIGGEGVRYLLSRHGINKKRAMRSDEYAARVKIMHDIHLQAFLSRKVESFANYYSEKNITSSNIKPDALAVISKSGPLLVERWDLDASVSKPLDVLNREKEANFDINKFVWLNNAAPVAFECEITRKSSKRFQSKLTQYARAIQSGRVSAVVFVFSDENIMAEYRKRFDREEWSSSYVSLRSGKVLAGEFLKVNLSNPLRARFLFEYMPPFPTQRMPKPKQDKAHKPSSVPPIGVGASL